MYLVWLWEGFKEFDVRMNRIKQFLKSPIGANIVIFGFVFLFLFLDRFVYFTAPRAHIRGSLDVARFILPWALVGMLPLWLMGRYSRFIYWVVAPVAVVFECVEWVARLNFGMNLTGSWLGIVMDSSPDEMRCFFWQYTTFKGVLCVLGVLVLIAFVCWCISLVRFTKVSKISLVAAFFSLLVFIYANNLPKSKLYGKTRPLPAVHLLPSTVHNFTSFRQFAQMKSSPSLPLGIRAVASTNEAVTGVFVIGESDTRTHWGLYGYPRDTTPEMSALREELVVFSDLVTPDGRTNEAIISLFTTRTLEAPSVVRYALPQVLRACGFDAALYSNQRRWDGFESSGTYAFAGCDPVLFRRKFDDTNSYDDGLLKHLDKSLASTSGPRVVFLHFLGSHYVYRDRYPESEDLPFDAKVGDKRQKTIDEYDNSIWYTDKILGEIVRRVRALHKPAWVVYVADHGETPSAKSWRTMTDLDLWEIPFIVWTSPEFRAQYPERIEALRRAKDKALQTDQLLPGLLRFMGVEGLDVAPRDDFLDDAFQPRCPRRIREERVPYPVDVKKGEK